MRHYPVFLDLHGQPVLVVGGGEVAARKVAMLMRAGASTTVLTPALCDDLRREVAAGRCHWQACDYHREALAGQRLVIAATGHAAVNARVAADAEARGVLVNVVDNPALCRFIVPSIVDRSPILVAISSGAAAPVLTRLLRERIEALLDPSLGALARFAERWRARIREAMPEVRKRRQFVESLLRGHAAWLIRHGHVEQAGQLLQRRIGDAASAEETGSVALIGAGVGDANLLTLSALRHLQDADVVLYDRLVSADILDLIRRDARRVDVGKRAGSRLHTQDAINRRLVAEARAGNRVVRLKGGDPLVFGRGGEEIDALRDAQVRFCVVPGITAASACAAHAGIPLTRRGVARAVHLFTAQIDDGADGARFNPPVALIDTHTTLVAYMGVSRLRALRRALLAAGRAPLTPVALVENGGRADQRVIVTDIAGLNDATVQHAVAAPALAIVGEVAVCALDNHWYGSAPIDARTAAAQIPTHRPACAA